MNYAIETLRHEHSIKIRNRDMIDESSPIWDLINSEIEDIENALKKLKE